MWLPSNNYRILGTIEAPKSIRVVSDYWGYYHKHTWTLKHFILEPNSEWRIYSPDYRTHRDTGSRIQEIRHTLDPFRSTYREIFAPWKWWEENRRKVPLRVTRISWQNRIIRRS